MKMLCWVIVSCNDLRNVLASKMTSKQDSQLVAAQYDMANMTPAKLLD